MTPAEGAQGDAEGVGVDPQQAELEARADACLQNGGVAAEERNGLSEAEMGEKVVRLRSLLQNDQLASILIKPKDLETPVLRRFLRARDGDVQAAFDQTLNVLKWRKAHKVDLILERDYEFVAQERWGMAYWHGRDKFGRPVLVIRGCRHDPALFNAETTIRYLIWKLETKLLEPDVDDVVVIVDCINTTRHNLDTKLALKLIPLLQTFYPERLGVCFVYPTLPIVWILWKMVSKRFDDKTEKKFVFVREQKRDDKFFKLIDEDQLQERFGGTSKEEFGMDGLGLVPPETYAENLAEAAQSPSSPAPAPGAKSSPHSAANPQSSGRLEDEDGDCLGPAAFEDLGSDSATEDFDTTGAIRANRGSLFGEDDAFHEFLDNREKEEDRFQLRLRYQVSQIRIDGQGVSDEGGQDSSSSQRSPLSPRSDVGDAAHRGPLHIRASSSEAGGSRRGKRANVKRFIRRHILRKKSELLERHARAAEDGLHQPVSPAISEEELSDAFESLPKQAMSDQGASAAHGRPSLDQEPEHVHSLPATNEPEAQQNVLRRSISTSAAGPRSPRAGPSSRASPRLSAGLSKRTSALMSPRSRRRVAREGLSTQASAFNLMDQVKFVMEAGASMKKLDREDPSRECNTWATCEPSRFETRVGPDYKRNKQKQPSGAAVYDCVCCDVWSLESKRPHIASYMDLPVLTESRPNSTRNAVAPLPELLIVNMMMPSYPATGPFQKKRIDGPGQSIVLFAKLSSWAKQNAEDPAVQVWSRFVHAHDGDPFRERLKMITRLENPDEVDMGRIERMLLKRYNGTPWLVRPEYEFHKGRGYFEIDIDYHLFTYFVLSKAMPVLERVHNAILDCALIIQAEMDQEMPERVLVCTTIRCLNLLEAPEIDLVVLDKSKSARQAKELSACGPSFIDRDGNVHPLHPGARRSSPRSRSGSASSANSADRQPSGAAVTGGAAAAALGATAGSTLTEPSRVAAPAQRRAPAAVVDSAPAQGRSDTVAASTPAEQGWFVSARPFLVSFANGSLLVVLVAMFFAWLVSRKPM